MEIRTQQSPLLPSPRLVSEHDTRTICWPLTADMPMKYVHAVVAYLAEHWKRLGVDPADVTWYMQHGR